jgi:penicillin-binding protein 1A
LSRIYLGGGYYGVDDASLGYFGKPVSEINIYESALIAGLIRAPSHYAPTTHPDRAAARASQVLLSMEDANLLSTPWIATQAYPMPKILPVVYTKKRIAPYFTDWIMEQLPDYVGTIDQDITVYTTLDTKLQNLAEQTIKERIEQEGTAQKFSQGALITLSPEGAVIAMVGGKSYGDSQYNRATDAMRQPGSSFKAIVYASAFEDGYTPDDIEVDEPIRFAGWSPENYRKQYVGAITLQRAFAESINTVAIKLAKDVGINNVISTAQKLGITSPIEPNLTSALGTSETTLLELTTAYAHFANAGNAVWNFGITEIRTGDVVLYKREPLSEKQRILHPATVAGMNRILTETILNGTGKNAILGRPAGGKTGTSQEYRDAWFIGYTPDYATGIWFGNDNNASMNNVTGGGAPAKSWREFMQVALADKKITSLPLSAQDVEYTKSDEDKPEQYREPSALWNFIFGGTRDNSREKELDIEYTYPHSSR